MSTFRVGKQNHENKYHIIKENKRKIAICNKSEKLTSLPRHDFNSIKEANVILNKPICDNCAKVYNQEEPEKEETVQGEIEYTLAKKETKEGNFAVIEANGQKITDFVAPEEIIEHLKSMINGEVKKVE